MRKIFFSLAVFCLVIFCSVPAALHAEEPPADVYHSDFSYFLGPGDTLDIKVWRHPDLDMKMTVRPDCGISYPILNEITVCDLTIAELRTKMTQGLAQVLNDPQLAVNVVTFQSQKIFVLGEVVRPGLYPFEGRVSVLDAMSRAGGYNKDTAVLRSVIVIRPGHDRKAQAFRLNVADVITKGEMKDNMALRSGDIVFVPKSFIAKLNTFIDQFFAKTAPVLQYYLDIIDIDQRTPSGRVR